MDDIKLQARIHIDDRLLSDDDIKKLIEMEEYIENHKESLISLVDKYVKKERNRFI